MRVRDYEARKKLYQTKPHHIADDGNLIAMVVSQYCQVGRVDREDKSVLVAEE